MTKLTKKQMATKADLAMRLADAKAKLDQAAEKHEKASHDAFQAVRSAVDDYNAIVKQAEEFRDEIINDATMYREDRSEKWHDSDAGSEHQDWVEEWESSEFDPVEIEEPERLDVGDADHATTLEDLPVAVGG